MKSTLSFDTHVFRGVCVRWIVLVMAVLLLTSCHSSRHASKGGAWGAGPKSASEALAGQHVDKKQKRLVEEAYTWLGAPYKYGGADKKKGTDCSGMVLRVYEDVAGVKLPRNSAKQAEYCKKIKRDKVRTGDLVFFATGKDPKKISHVGIMVTPEYFIHASTSKGVVVSDVNTPYYQRTFIQYGTVK